MQPTKRSNRGGLVLGEAPAKKAPEPPNSRDASNKPSLLKALEAVVAAGRRGLLGPAALAAVEAVPDLELGFGDEEVGQETPSPIPCEEEKKEEGKSEDKECETLVAVAPPVEGVGSEGPTPKEVWICGNSVIKVAATRARFSFHGLRLGLPIPSVYMNWRGNPTMMWDDLLPLVHHIYYYRPRPSIIVIHLGENDLWVNSTSSFLTRMQNDLGLLRRVFPNVVIIWSALLPKHFWQPSENPRIMESKRNTVNRKMEDYCHENGVCYLPHPLITKDNKCLFMPDNTLSVAGTDIFLIDLKQVLKTYVVPNPS